MFYSRSFIIVSGLTFRFLIHFKLIFVYGVRKCSNLILSHVAVQFFPIIYLRDSFPHCTFLSQDKDALDKQQTKETCCKIFSSVQLLSHVWLFATPWTVARQASLSITNSQSPLKFMSIELVILVSDNTDFRTKNTVRAKEAPHDYDKFRTTLPPLLSHGLTVTTKLFTMSHCCGSSVTHTLQGLGGFPIDLLTEPRVFISSLY